MTEPVLLTRQLILRPYNFSDAPAMYRLLGAREIADGTLRIPHPYEVGMAEKWLFAHAESHERTGSVVLAITTREEEALCGSIGLHVEREHQRAELGYWIGVPFWGRGYATEAAWELVNFGFRRMGLHRIFASHYATNPGSGRVMQKIGMRYEGRMRQHVRKWDEFRDLEMYGILAEEWG